MLKASSALSSLSLLEYLVPGLLPVVRQLPAGGVVRANMSVIHSEESAVRPFPHA